MSYLRQLFYTQLSLAYTMIRNSQRIPVCPLGVKWGKKNQSHYRPEVPSGFQEVKVPRLRDNGTGWW